MMLSLDREHALEPPLLKRHVGGLHTLSVNHSHVFWNTTSFPQRPVFHTMDDYTVMKSLVAFSSILFLIFPH